MKLHNTFCSAFLQCFILIFSLDGVGSSPKFFKKKTRSYRACRGARQFCKEDYWCPGGGVNLSLACPTGLYSRPGSDNVSQCKCPTFSSASWKSASVQVRGLFVGLEMGSLTSCGGQVCTCNAGYYKVMNYSSPLGGWQCEVCLPAPARAVWA